MITVTLDRGGLIDPETVRELPMVMLEGESRQDMVLWILDKKKENDKPVAPSCSMSPSHEAFTPHEPAVSGTKVYE